MRTPLVAFVDSDTYYPPHYLALAAELFQAGGPRRVAVMSKDLSCPPDSPSGRWTRWFYPLLARLLYWQAFVGGCGQTFCTAAFRQAGGYSAAGWKYTLEDHEIINRIRKVGRWCYHRDLWCLPAPRHRNRARVSWNKLEQLVYLLTPPALGDWFFYRFLARRFEQRQIWQTNLREQDWHPAADGRASQAA